MSYTGIILPSQPLISPGNTGTFDGQPNIIGAFFMINVSAVSGTATPTLDFSIKCFDPASNSYFNIAVITQITTTGKYVGLIYPNASGAIYQILPAGYRIEWVLGGTNPSFTTSISVCYLE